jgi:hypothetical protein
VLFLILAKVFSQVWRGYMMKAANQRSELDASRRSSA